MGNFPELPRLFLVQGARHSCVVLVPDSEKAIKKAGEGIIGLDILTENFVSNWELPFVQEVKLPSGWELRQAPAPIAPTAPTASNENFCPICSKKGIEVALQRRVVLQCSRCGKKYNEQKASVS